MDQASPVLPPGARIVGPPSRRSHRLLIVFAVVGTVLALAAGGLYVYQHRDTAPTAAEVAHSSPEDAVRAFLSAVFLTQDVTRLPAVVCSGWNPANAMERTRAEFPITDAPVVWESVRTISSDASEASVSARLGQPLNGAPRPSTYAQWHFALKAQDDGWHVCEARPFLT